MDPLVQRLLLGIPGGQTVASNQPGFDMRSEFPPAVDGLGNPAHPQINFSEPEVIQGKPKAKAKAAPAPAPTPEPLFNAPPVDAQQEIDAGLARQLLDSMKAQQERTTSYDDQIKKVQDGRDGLAGVNLKPLMALTDSWTGSKLAQSYDGPPGELKKQALIQQLQAARDKASTGLDNSQIKYLQMRASQESAKDRNAQMAQLAGVRQNLGERRLDLMDDRFAKSVGDSFTQDKVITNLVDRRQQIGRDMHTLETATIITPQIFDELQKGVANAITGAKSASVSDTASMKIHTVDQDFANLMQRVKSKPQDINNPELKKYMHDLLVRLDDAYAQNIKDRAGQKNAQTRNYGSKKAKAVAADAMGGLTGDAGGNDDADAIAWAQANPDDPRAKEILSLHGR